MVSQSYGESVIWCVRQMLSQSYGESVTCESVIW